MADDTLEWGLKVDAETAGADKLDGVLKTLDGTMKLLDFHLAHIEQNTRKAGKGHQEHGHEANKLKEIFVDLVKKGLDPFLHKAKEIAEFEFIREGTSKLLELPEKLADEVRELGAEMLRTAADAQRFDQAFKGALGQEAGEQTLGYIAKIGKHTEFTQRQLKEMELTLAKAGFKGTGLGRGVEAAIDLASMSSNPQQGGPEAISALQRVMATERLESRALVPFGISEQTLMAELSKETGFGSKTLKKKMEQGTLDIETTLNSLYTVITRKTGKALGGAGADMENLLTTRLKNLHEIPELVYEKMKDTEGFGQISDFIGNLADKLDPDGEIGGHIVDGLGSVFNRVGKMLDEVNLDGILQQGLSIIEEMPDAIEAVVHTFEAVADVAKPIFDAMGYVADKVLGPSGTGYGDVSPSRAEAVEELVSRRLRLEQQARRQLGDSFPAEYGPQKMGKARLDELRAEASKALGGGQDLNAAAAKMADAFMASLQDRMKGGQGGTERAGEEVGRAVVRGTRGALQMHSPSRVMQDLADQTTDSFADRVEDNASRIEAAMRASVTVPSGRGARGGVAVNLAPVINIHAQPGQSADDIADVVVARLKEMAVGDLADAFSLIAMQTGSAAA